jgi:integrase
MENPSVPALPLPTGTHLPAHLVGPTSRYVESGLRGAANTIRAYAGDWARFTTWCQTHQLDSLPAPVEALAGFLTELAEAGKKVATIQRHAAAIAKAHELAGLDSPTADKKVKVLLKGIAREKKTRIKQAAAFTLATFKRTLKSIDVSTPTGLRNRALLLLGFTGAFRRSELVVLNVEDVELTCLVLVIHLRRSKTNQYGEEEDKTVFYAPSANYCSVRAVQDWLAVLGRPTGAPFYAHEPGCQPASRATR